MTIGFIPEGKDNGRHHFIPEGKDNGRHHFIPLA